MFLIVKIARKDWDFYKSSSDYVTTRLNGKNKKPKKYFRASFNRVLTEKTQELGIVKHVLLSRLDNSKFKI
jgi:hypothetical protein